MPHTNQPIYLWKIKQRSDKNQIRVTHQRLAIHGSTEYPAKAKYPPDHDDQEQGQEDIVNMNSVHSQVKLQWELGEEDQEIKVAQDPSYNY